MIIIPMAKLTKIFVPELQHEFMRNPASIHDDTPFSFTMVTSRRDYRFEYNSPKFETDPLLLNWLLGGDDGLQNQETAWSGLVALDLDAITNGKLLGAVAGMSKIDKSANIIIEETKEKAKKLAEDRVMRQIRAINSNLKKQYEINRTNNESPYTPSPTEFLCAYVLAEEQKQDTASKKEITDMFAEMMKKTF